MQEFYTYTTPSLNSIVACAVSTCGSYLAFNSDAKTLQVVSLKSLRQPLSYKGVNSNDILNVLFECKMGSEIRCLDFGWGDEKNTRLPHRSSKRRITYPVMNDACLLAVGMKSGQVKVYSLVPGCYDNDSQSVVEGSGNAKLILHNHYEDMTTLSFSLDGSLRLVSISIDGKICLWDMWDDGNMYKSINLPKGFNPLCCAWGSTSKQICVTGKLGKGFIYQSEKPCMKLATLEQVHRNDISACKYTSDDSLLGTSSFDTSVVIWCAATYKPMLQIWQTGFKPSLIFMGGSHTRYIRDFAFSPDCVNLVSLCDDNLIRLWNLDGFETPIDELSVPFIGRKLVMNCVKFTPDGSTVIVCTSEGKLHFFNVENSPQSLVNLCRKSVRGKLIFQLHYLLGNHMSFENQSDAMTPISFLEIIQHTKWRRSLSDALKMNDCMDSIHLSDIVEELPVPEMIKKYLQYGLTGSQFIDNTQPMTLRSYIRHNSII